MNNNTIFTSGNNSITLTTSTSGMYGEKRLIDVKVKETTIEISYRQSPNFTYCGGFSSTPPDRVWKEVYGLKDGKMTLLKAVEGKHVQAQHIPESFEFDEDQE